MLADLKPSGRYLMSEFVAIGGIQPLMKMLLDGGLLLGDCLTVTGRTLAENLAETGTYIAEQDWYGRCRSRSGRKATSSFCTGT